ncbi:hypothetical protein [Halorussus salinus]|uniref:hypothetical protein n=1 Tax=Halorussus salinus TaxID=1364935 RepID=UPI00138EE909|nr:hypothetical protein [Halorussus salinus]
MVSTTRPQVLGLSGLEAEERESPTDPETPMSRTPERAARTTGDRNALTFRT